MALISEPGLISIAALVFEQLALGLTKVPVPA